MQTYGIDGKLLKLLKSYLKDRQQRVLLNGQTSSWKNVLAGVPQGSVLGPLLFLIYINDLSDGLTSICKIFSDYTSLFSKAINKEKSEIEPNKDLKLTSQWAYQWKMLFNPDPTKPNKLQKFASHTNVTTFLTNLWLLIITKYNLHLFRNIWGLS